MGALLFAAGISFMLFLVDRSSPWPLFLAVAACVPGYYLALRTEAVGKHTYWFGLGLGLRLAGLFAFPLLSDDIYRFLWDGELWLAGHHPLLATPEALSLQDPAFAKTHIGLLAEMNSPGYFTVYPPFAQMLFVFSALGNLTPFAASVLLKLPLLAADWGVYTLIGKMASERKRTAQLAWWLHPLLIIEVAGNAHFESLALLFVLMALWYSGFMNVSTHEPASARNYGWAGVFLGLGVLTKMLPLLAAPYMALRVLVASWPKLSQAKWLAFPAAMTATLLLGFGAMFYGIDVAGFGESLDLYFRKFEFNGSLYQLARSWGNWYRGWNWIASVGPAMAMLSGLGILVWSVWALKKQRAPALVMLGVFTIYFAMSTTVHPWYFIYLLGFGVLTGYRWPVLLGFTAFFSYYAYAVSPIEVPAWALMLEYLPVLGLGMYEWRQRSGQRQSAIPSV